MKKRQHTVWRHYLNSWAEIGSIYCLRGTSIFETNTINVAVEHNYYKLSEFNSEDLLLIRTLVINLSPSTARESFERLLNITSMPSKMIDRFSDGSAASDKIRRNALNYANDIIEDLHSSIEQKFLINLSNALSGNLDFYRNNSECAHFFYFLCNQHLRTKNMKQRVVQGMKEIYNQDFSRIYDVMAIMHATNIGASLYVERSRRSLSIIDNHTNFDFITCDQPTINLYSKENSLPDKLSFFYPISPKKALILSEVDEEPLFSTATLTPSVVAELNSKMYQESHSQVYATDRRTLELLLDIEVS